MTLDLLIRGGTVVDGSGGKRFAVDVGVSNGRIARIGCITDAARRTIDADGLIVSPGFVDGHTHMDAQVMWDPLGTCSCYRGVTSVVMSNCGFTLAPCKPSDRERAETGRVRKRVCGNGSGLHNCIIRSAKIVYAIMQA